MPFSAIFDVAALNGANGFVISNAPNSGGYGVPVAIVRDLNADGFDDFVIGIRNGIASSPVFSGTSFVVFGQASGAANIDLSAFSGSRGFIVSGMAAYDFSGWSVASAGDVNNDGLGDLIIGARQADPNGDSSGAAYVLFGTDNGFAAIVSPGSLNGANGFRIAGPSASALAGAGVSSAGDVNGDGYDDVIVNANGALNAGAVYVVFGGATVSADINLASLDGASGFRITKLPFFEGIGLAASSAGDFNGDGYADILLSGQYAGAQGNGAAYVVFGGASVGAGGSISAGALTGANGFALQGASNGSHLGAALASAGDVNGDGFDDFVVSAPGAGAAFVVFGTAQAMPATLSIDALDGVNGFRINGPGSEFGHSVAGGGDVNGDGLADIIIGAPVPGAGGTAYVVYGSRTAFAPILNVANLDGTNGFAIAGASAYSARSVSIGGDFNNDGADDIVISGGITYVIYGQPPQPIVETGTAGADSYTGAGLGDQLSGGDGNDILRGMGGDDILDGGDLSDQLFGGDGKDQLSGGTGGDILYGDAGDDTLDGGDGADKLFGGTGADQLNGGTGNDRMAGEADIDTLRGGAGNDYLDGGVGADIMYGGADNDIYIVDDALDQTIELANEGYDIVRTTLTWTLADNIEGLELQGSASASGTGNSGANNLQGNSGNNTLSGLAGVDTINGNDGDDIIIGGQGNDLLRGGTGADTFRVDHAFGPVLETDQIYDFSTAEGDIMDFQGAYGGTLSVVSAFTRHAGEMTLSFAAGITTVRLDIDGNGQPEYQVKINGDVTGDLAGWLL